MSIHVPVKLEIVADLLPSHARSFSRLTAYEAARILRRLGADVRVFDPTGLPVKDDVSDKHEKVVELRALSDWSDAHFWCSPEQHGTVTAVFKNQSPSRRLFLRSPDPASRADRHFLFPQLTGSR